MEKVVIQPKRQRFEIIFMLASVVAVLAVASLLIAINRAAKDERVRLKPYQIDAFYTLSGNDQGIFSDLYSAALEIEAMHRDGGEIWPTVAELSDRNLALAPFTEDAVWRERGQHRWSLFTHDQGNVHRAIYIAKSGNEAVAGNFLLLSEHFHSIDGSYYIGVNRPRPYSIWFNPSWSLPNASNISEGTLIAAGWKEAIPYTGSDELRRIGRE